MAFASGSTQRTNSSRIPIPSPKRPPRRAKDSLHVVLTKEQPSPVVLSSQKRSSDWQTLEEMFRSSHSKFVRIAYRILRNREDAEDAVQNALVSAYVHLPVFEGRSALTTWFTRIVLNAALMIVRKRKHTHVDLHPESANTFETNWLDAIPAPQPDPESAFGQKEKLELIDNLLGEVNPGLSQAFTLTYRHGFGAKEVGDLLGLPTGTVKARLFRAKQFVKRRALRSLSARNRAIQPRPVPPFAPALASEFAGV